mmetsp:Transcript_28869/g.79572  ORF Transcript_28869/g.79572 Transcript_28869/m.79572 type:complete len:377 (+) Transcript_28869:719-1849(+)
MGIFGNMDPAELRMLLFDQRLAAWLCNGFHERLAATAANSGRGDARVQRQRHGGRRRWFRERLRHCRVGAPDRDLQALRAAAVAMAMAAARSPATGGAPMLRQERVTSFPRSGARRRRCGRRRLRERLGHGDVGGRRRVGAVAAPVAWRWLRESLLRGATANGASAVIDNFLWAAVIIVASVPDTWPLEASSTRASDAASTSRGREGGSTSAKDRATTAVPNDTARPERLAICHATMVEAWCLRVRRRPPRNLNRDAATAVLSAMQGHDGRLRCTCGSHRNEGVATVALRHGLHGQVDIRDTPMLAEQGVQVRDLARIRKAAHTQACPVIVGHRADGTYPSQNECGAVAGRRWRDTMGDTGQGGVQKGLPDRAYSA